MLKYYISYSGVNANYGSQVFDWVTKGELDKLTTKKRNIIDEINKLSEIKTKEEFGQIEIKGIGEGAKAFILEHYFNDTNIIYPTDRVFQKGMCIIYGLKTITISEAKVKARTWKGQKSVGSMFCFQVANYFK